MLRSRAMAMCCVARRVGVPSLRGVSGPHPSPSAGSGPLASRSSQTGYSNGDAARKMKNRLGESVVEMNAAGLEMDGVAKVKASFQAAREAVEHARRMEKLKWRFFLGSCAAGVGLGLCAIPYLARQAAVVVSR